MATEEAGIETLRIHNLALREIIEELRQRAPDTGGGIAVFEFERAAEASLSLFSLTSEAQVREALGKYSATLFDVRDCGVAMYNGQELQLHFTFLSTSLAEIAKKLELAGMFDAAIEAKNSITIAENNSVEHSTAVVIAPMIVAGECMGIFLARSSEEPSDIEPLALRTLQFVANTAAAMLLTLRKTATMQELDARLRSLTRRLTLAAQQAAVGDVVGGLAEEFSAPLSIMKSNITLLQDGIGNPELRYNVLRKQISALEEVALSLNRLTTDRQDEEATEAVSLPLLVEEVVALMRHRLQREGIQTELEYDEQTPSVQAVRRQLEQALLNVILNARDAMPRGGKITFSVYQDDEANICLTVTDTGIGMTPEVMASAFEAFFSTNPRKTGLGLSICRDIMQQHGGTIILHSEQGKGTHVKFIFPQ